MGQSKGEVSLISDGTEWTVMVVGRPENPLSRVVHDRSSREALSLLRAHLQLNQIKKGTPLLIVEADGKSHRRTVGDLFGGDLKLDDFRKEPR